MPGADKPSFKERLAAGAKVALEKAQEGKEKLAEVKAEHDAKPKEYKFAGVKLIGTERVESKQGGGSVHGAKATVETLGQIRGRRTVKTLGLHQKKIDERRVLDDCWSWLGDLGGGQPRRRDGSPRIRRTNQQCGNDC
jgi:hypothetical protein